MVLGEGSKEVVVWGCKAKGRARRVGGAGAKGHSGLIGFLIVYMINYQTIIDVLVLLFCMLLAHSSQITGSKLVTQYLTEAAAGRCSVVRP